MKHSDVIAVAAGEIAERLDMRAGRDARDGGAGRGVQGSQRLRL